MILSVAMEIDRVGFHAVDFVASTHMQTAVRVPKEYRVAGPGHDAHFYYGAMSGTQWHSSIMSLGISEAAFEIALDYTKERRSFLPLPVKMGL